MNDIDYWELNEAFAAQFLAVNRELNIPMNQVNANGSGILTRSPRWLYGSQIADHVNL